MAHLLKHEQQSIFASYLTNNSRHMRHDETPMHHNRSLHKIEVQITIKFYSF